MMLRGIGVPLRLGSIAVALVAFPSFPLLANGSRLGGGEPLEVSLGRIVGALIICIMITIFAVLLIRQRKGKIDLAALFGRIELRQRAVQVVETRRLSAHADICLVRHDGQEFLLLLLAGRATILRERAVAPAPEAEA